MIDQTTPEQTPAHIPSEEPAQIDDGMDLGEPMQVAEDSDFATFEKLFMTPAVSQRWMPFVHATIIDLKKAVGVSPEDTIQAMMTKDDPVHEEYAAPLIELVVEVLGIAYQRMEFELTEFQQYKALAESLTPASRGRHANAPAFNPLNLPRGSRSRKAGSKRKSK